MALQLFNTLSFKSLADRIKEKQKDYRNIVVIQMIIIVFGLTLSEPLIENPHSEESKLIISIFSFFGATYAFLLWDLLRNFTDNRWLVTTMFAVLASIVVTGILVEFPYYQILQVPNRQIYLFTIHGLLFPIEVTVISFAVRDIFSGKFLTSDKLWGAACVYLMIGISFGSLYDLITIARPGSLGVDAELGLPNYAECVTFSLSVLGGVDAGIDNTSRLIRNISVLEGVWGAIYGMLIIGKMLGLPRQETTDQ